MPEIKDFPYMHRLNILEVGSLAGEEDILARSVYSCSLKCYSHKGTVYKMAKDYFKMLKQSDHSWLEVMEKIAYKECRSEALDIKKATPQMVKKPVAEVQK